MRGWLCLVALLTACGGAASSDVFGDPPPAPGQTADPAATTTAPAPTTTTPKPGPPDPKPCATTTYYRDADGDGFGGAVTQAACDSPGSGWVTKGGDCADDDKDVYPGQSKYFNQSYTRPGGAHSFDYDCSTKEEQKAPARKAAAPCAFVAGACTGDGVIPVPRTGVGVDSLCGATQQQACTLKLTGPPGVCEATITSIEPISCR